MEAGTDGSPLALWRRLTRDSSLVLVLQLLDLLL